MDGEVPNVATVVVRMADMSSPDLHLQLALDDTVLSLKKQIHADHVRKPPVNTQKLIYAGRMMRDDDNLRSLLSPVTADSVQTVHLIVVGRPWATPSSRSCVTAQRERSGSATGAPQGLPPGQSGREASSGTRGGQTAPQHAVPASAQLPLFQNTHQGMTAAPNGMHAGDNGGQPHAQALRSADGISGPPPQLPLTIALATQTLGTSASAYWQWYNTHYDLSAYMGHLGALRSQAQGGAASPEAAAVQQYQAHYLEWCSQYAQHLQQYQLAYAAQYGEALQAAGHGQGMASVGEEANVNAQAAINNNQPPVAPAVAEFDDDEGWGPQRQPNQILVVIRVAVFLCLFGRGASPVKTYILVAIAILLFLQQTGRLDLGALWRQPADRLRQQQGAAPEGENGEANDQGTDQGTAEDTPQPLQQVLRPTLLQEVETFLVNFFTSLFPAREAAAAQLPAAPVFG